MIISILLLVLLGSTTGTGGFSLPYLIQGPTADDCKQLSNYGMSFHFTVLDSDDSVNDALEPARLSLVPIRSSGQTHLSIRAGTFSQDGEFAAPEGSTPKKVNVKAATGSRQGTFDLHVCRRFQNGAELANATGRACIIAEKAVRVQTNQPVAAAVSQGDESFTLIPDDAAGQHYVVGGWFPPANPQLSIK